MFFFLKSIYFQICNLLFYFRGIFSELKRLFYVNLENNRLKYIPDNAFPADCKIVFADFGNNEISIARENEKSPFYNCRDLQSLILSNNRIHKIYEDWKNFSNLRHLDLTNNSLTSINISVNYILI